MAKKKLSNLSKGVVKEPSAYKQGQVAQSSKQYAVYHSADGHVLPPPGPSNIIVRTANPLPAPKDVKSQ